MTSDRAGSGEDPWASPGPPPDWVGDVGLGVQAWTHGAGADEPAERAPRKTRRSSRGAGSSSQRQRSRRSAPPAAEVDPEPVAEDVARKILLDQLTGQARSRKELADKLASREVPAELATRLLDRFEEVGLIDDAAFARSWIASRQPGKGLARRALAQELRRKGIADDVARAALDEIDPDDEQEAGRALVRKKLRSMARLDHATRTRRLVGMLARKGYSSGVAFQIVREETADLADDTAADMPDSLP